MEDSKADDSEVEKREPDSFEDLNQMVETKPILFRIGVTDFQL